ncbi:MAG: phosphoribosylformylglycinamidine synthase [Cyclobacteriaceae bacterium]|jgi:phosphoribosylformylglycinamidine synthase
MIVFFEKSKSHIYALSTSQVLSESDISKLEWLFSGAKKMNDHSLTGHFIGPRKEMITPWSTNAVEICQNAGIDGLERIEEFVSNRKQGFDPMLKQLYNGIDQEAFKMMVLPEAIRFIDDLEAYNKEAGLALSGDEIGFLEKVASEIERPLTDSEVFGFSQINSEHCRHKIFNGTFIINGEEKKQSLFQLIKNTSKANHNFIVSAYKDNVAFVSGSTIEQFAPATQDKPDFFEIKPVASVISLKAETHNFPTTVEPFNGAATGSGGEIRDRMAGGLGSMPLAGSAVYMTSYPRLIKGKNHEENIKPRKWLYQSPKEILIKASNGASDFGNKFGQPMIVGSLFTFEHEENGETIAFDKVIMQAGGIGYGHLKDAIKKPVGKNESVVVMGGDNYRIGMGGSAVSSLETGALGQQLELNAVQRSNPEMQKRVANAVRAMAEMDENPIISIHDHGAGGHLNCLSELVEDSGANIDLDKLPVGDVTLSEKEIIGNESQERMGLVIKPEHVATLKAVAERERAPFYEVGTTTGNHELKFHSAKRNTTPFFLKTEHLFGSSPKTILEDIDDPRNLEAPSYDVSKLIEYLHQVLQLEAVACKDWLTNKVDRSVTGKVALQQTVGEIQLPLNNLGVMALDYTGTKGIATSIGHAPAAALVNAAAGSRLSIAEALSNLVWAPLLHGIKGISLSANWMWPAKNHGENARLYEAVESVSEFAIALGINIPTGKDSLSMTQKYADKKVQAPGTVIISSVGEVKNVKNIITPNIKNSSENTFLYYIDFSDCDFNLGGSSFGQIHNAIGGKTPDVKSTTLMSGFEAVQILIEEKAIVAGHDISSGGLITTLLEMNFPNKKGGMTIDLNVFDETDLIKILFSEKPAVIVQVTDEGKATDIFNKTGAKAVKIGNTTNTRLLNLAKKDKLINLDIDELRDTWYYTSHLFDLAQTNRKEAFDRLGNYKKQPLRYEFNSEFTGQFKDLGIDPNRKTKSGLKAAIIREKGVNGDREMAFALHLAGFDVKDVHMTDLATGREDLSDIRMIVFVGGFSNSDVLGSAKGWAGSFLYNEKAKSALDNFYSRGDTLSLGVCNGCQLMMELGLLMPELGENHPRMHHNSSGKFESAFVDVVIEENNSIMFNSLAGSRMGIWLAHGEGKFILEGDASKYAIPVKYANESFPGNPNGSDFGTAAISSKDGRHVAMMPHLERSIFTWNWPHYEMNTDHEVTPWITPFLNARKWIENN